jgi:hypothetical protein
MAGSDRPGAIRFDVRLTAGFFDGDTVPGTPEWPPAPYRVFAALRAGAAALRLTESPEAERRAVDALDQLESAGRPVIHASMAWPSRRDTFVPVIPDYGRKGLNRLDAPKKSERVKAEYFPRISTSLAAKPVTRLYPDVPRVAFDVAEHNLTHDDVRALDRAAAEICYFGRSTSPAAVCVSTDTAPVPGTFALVPESLARAAGAGAALAVWGPGTVDALDHKHDAPTRGHVRVRGRPPADTAWYATPFGAGRIFGQAGGTWDALTPADGALRTAAVIRAHGALNRFLEPAKRRAKLCLIANAGHRFAGGQLGLALSCDSEQSRGKLVSKLRDQGWLPDESRRWLRRGTWTASARTFATAVPFRCPVGSAARVKEETRQRLSQWGELEHLAVSRQPYLRGLEPVEDRRYWFAVARFASPLPVSDFPRCLGKFDGTLYPIPEAAP